MQLTYIGGLFCSLLSWSGESNSLLSKLLSSVFCEGYICSSIISNLSTSKSISCLIFLLAWFCFLRLEFRLWSLLLVENCSKGKKQVNNFCTTIHLDLATLVQVQHVKYDLEILLTFSVQVFWIIGCRI